VTDAPVAVALSPKFHAMLAIVPSLSLALAVKVTVLSATLAVGHETDVFVVGAL
jgi:hypothetical protein